MINEVLGRNVTTLKSITPEMLGERFLQKAKHGFICPNPACRDGAGKDGTGMTVYHNPDGTYSYYCGKCGRRYDNIDVLGFYYNLDPKRDFVKILEHAADNFDIPELANSIDERPIEQAKPEVPDKHKDLILKGEKNLKVFLHKCRDGIWRGLSAETLQAFSVGYLPNWYARKGAPPTPRIIIPTSYNHYLARLDGNIEDFNVPDDVHLDAKEHRGSKEFFNYKRAVLDSNDPIIFVVEGEIDCMSIYQTTGGEINVVALLGSDLATSLERQIKTLTVKKNFVIMLDNDETGDKKAPILANKFKMLGHNATVMKLSAVYKDANDFLQADPEGLKNRMKELYQNAQKFFANVVSNIPFDVKKIQEWESLIGTIKPSTLTELKNAAIRISNTTDYYTAATDTTTLNFLGMFRYYSCFDTVNKNFFAQLRAVRNAAKIKVKAFTKSVTDAQKYKDATGIDVKPDDNLIPTDSERGLVELNIKKLDETVDKFATQAKREHKKWLNQKKIDDANAEREAYAANPNTTQQFISDCPVDLVLPEGVYLTENYIKIVDWDKPVGQVGRPVIIATRNPIVPTKVFRNPTTNLTQIELAIKFNGIWQNVIVDGKTIADARSIVSLASYGALIINAKYLCRYLADIIATNVANGRLKSVKWYTQPGWQDKDFKSFVYPTGGDDYIVQNGEFPYKDIFTPHGDKDLWLKMFDRVLFHDPEHPDLNLSKPNIVAAMTLGSTIGAPLIAPLGIRNQQMILSFDSGHGKTAAAKFALTFYGDPFYLAPTCNATENFLENLALKLNDFPHAVDELQAAKKKVRENMDEILYNFTGGVTRGRANINGDAKSVYYYRGMRTFTGEQGVINDNSGNGAIARIFEIKKSDLFADRFAIKIHNFSTEHFGHFGKKFTTEFIPQNLERIKHTFKCYQDSFIDSSNLLSSHATFLAYTMTGLTFGLEVLGYSQDKISAIICDILDDIQELIDDAPDKTMAKNINRALPAVFDFVDTHPKNFIREFNTESGSSFTPAEGNETYGVKLLNGTVAFFPSALRRILNRELDFPSALAIIRGFGEAGYFDGKKAKKQSYQKRLPKQFSDWFQKVAWFYILKPQEDLQEPKD